MASYILGKYGMIEIVGLGRNEKRRQFTGNEPCVTRCEKVNDADDDPIHA